MTGQVNRMMFDAGFHVFDSGTPKFWLGLLFFKEEDSRTSIFKILVRTLYISCPDWSVRKLLIITVFLDN